MLLTIVFQFADDPIEQHGAHDVFHRATTPMTATVSSIKSRGRPAAVVDLKHGYSWSSHMNNSAIERIKNIFLGMGIVLRGKTPAHKHITTPAPVMYHQSITTPSPQIRSGWAPTVAPIPGNVPRHATLHVPFDKTRISKTPQLRQNVNLPHRIDTPNKLIGAGYRNTDATATSTASWKSQTEMNKQINHPNVDLPNVGNEIYSDPPRISPIANVNNVNHMNAPRIGVNHIKTPRVNITYIDPSTHGMQTTKLTSHYTTAPVLETQTQNKVIDINTTPIPKTNVSSVQLPNNPQMTGIDIENISSFDNSTILNSNTLPMQQGIHNSNSLNNEIIIDATPNDTAPFSSVIEQNQQTKKTLNIQTQNESVSVTSNHAKSELSSVQSNNTLNVLPSRNKVDAQTIILPNPNEDATTISRVNVKRERTTNAVARAFALNTQHVQVKVPKTKITAKKTTNPKTFQSIMIYDASYKNAKALPPIKHKIIKEIAYKPIQTPFGYNLWLGPSGKAVSTFRFEPVSTTAGSLHTTQLMVDATTNTWNYSEYFQNMVKILRFYG